MATSNLKRKIISAVTAAALFATSATVTTFAASTGETEAVPILSFDLNSDSESTYDLTPDLIYDVVSGVVSKSSDSSVSVFTPELADEAELEELYIQGLFYGGVASPFKDYGSKHLTGNQKVIYDLLREGVENIADGKKTKAQFDLPTDGYADYDTLKKEISADVGAALDCLLVDLPQAFYWYDKTVGCFTGYGYSTNGNVTVYNASVDFAVSDDYVAANAETLSATIKYSDGTSKTVYYKVEVDPAKMTAAKKAVANAQEIAAKYSGKTEAEKIKGYRDEICALVSYNSNAASNNNTPYGDPWQLVYVFDEDSTTNVVCEGYSKAFQYLCDLGGVECYTVTGTMSGGTGAGPHMWNIVVSGDKSYLVDITNCDEGTVGADEKLLLKGATKSDSKGCTFSDIGITYTYDSETLALYDTANILTVSTTDYVPPADEHVHDFDASKWESDKDGHWHVCAGCDEQLNYAKHTAGSPVRENVVEATCKKAGSYEEVVYCKVCEYEISRTKKTIDQLEHTPDEAVKENEKAASCAEEGSYDEVVYCKVCGDEISREKVTVKKIDHTPGEAVRGNVTEATCTENGSCDEIIKCTVCGEVIKTTHTIIPAASHDFGAEWESDETSHWQKCSVCGEKVGELAHTKDHGTVTIRPTETEDGVRIYSCTVCGKQLEEETVEALGENHLHDYTIKNSNETDHWSECKCGEKDDTTVEAHTTDTIEEEALAATCNVNGLKYVITYCTECEREIGRVSEVIEKTGKHIESDKYEKDTENHWKVCTVCGSVLTPEAHKGGEPVKENEKAASCTEEGSYDEVVYCEVCETEMSRDAKTSEKTPHSFTNYVSDGNATCTEDGTKTAKCDNCDATDTTEDLGSATGHDFGDWTITVTPTYNMPGRASRVCKNDSTHVADVTVAPLSDTSVWTPGERVEPTATEDGSQEYTSEYGTVTVVLPKTGSGSTVVDPPYTGGGFTDPASTTEATTAPETAAESSGTASTDAAAADTSTAETAAAVNEPDASTASEGADSTPEASDTTALPGIPDTVNTPAAVKAEIKTALSELVSSLLTAEELEQTANGASAEIVLSVEMKNGTVSEEDKAAVAEALKTLNGYSVGQYLNIDLYKVINGNRQQVTEIGTSVAIVIDIPEALRANGREFAIVRVHNGQTDILRDTDNDPATITVETDRFSTYAIVYSDKTADKNGNPNTGDSNTSAWAIAIAAEMLLSIAVFLGLNKFFQKKENK